MSERMSDRMSGDMPERMSKRVPEEMSDRMSGRMSERMPEGMSEDISERRSKHMSADCFQSVCEVESNRSHFRRCVVYMSNNPHCTRRAVAVAGCFELSWWGSLEDSK